MIALKTLRKAFAVGLVAITAYTSSYFLGLKQQPAYQELTSSMQLEVKGYLDSVSPLFQKAVKQLSEGDYQGAVKTFNQVEVLLSNLNKYVSFRKDKVYGGLMLQVEDYKQICSDVKTFLDHISNLRQKYVIEGEYFKLTQLQRETFLTHATPDITRESGTVLLWSPEWAKSKEIYVMKTAFEVRIQLLHEYINFFRELQKSSKEQLTPKENKYLQSFFQYTIDRIEQSIDWLEAESAKIAPE